MKNEIETKKPGKTQLSVDRGHPGSGQYARIYTKKNLQRNEYDLHPKQALQK